MKRLNDLIVEFLHIPEERIADRLTPADVPDWDSMNYLLFIAEVEKEYGVTLTMDEVLGTTSLGDVRALLVSRNIDA